MDNASAVTKSARHYVKRRITGNWVVTVSAALLIVIVLAAIFAPFIVPYGPKMANITLRNSPPGTLPGPEMFPHVLGTDSLGRDVLSRLIYGARISLVVGLLSVVLSGTIGVTVGLLAGFHRGRWDRVIMRAVDVQMGLPSLLLALLVLYVLGPGILNVVLVLALTRWMVYARLVRGVMLSLREQQFFEAILQLGARDSRAILRHGLPNVLGPVTVLAVLEMATVMLLEASLDFLGLGIQPPNSSWGLMLAEGKDYMTVAWWQVTMPGIAIMITALGLNGVANGLRREGKS